MSTFLIMSIVFNFILVGVGLYNIEKPLTTTQLLSNIFNMLTSIFHLIVCGLLLFILSHLPA